MPQQNCLCGSSAVVLVVLSLLIPPLPLNFFTSSPKNENDLDKIVMEVADTHKNTFPELDLLPGLIILGIALTAYVYAWIRRKLMERRICKLRAVLDASLERLRETDARREHLDGTLKLARGAAAEYNLMLYLLLRRRKDIPAFNQDHFG